MNRRRQYNQAFEYNRYSDGRSREQPTRGIEYQDDSLSSVNSDEENYLHKTKADNNAYHNKAGSTKISKQAAQTTENYPSKEAQYPREPKYTGDSQYQKEMKYQSDSHYGKDLKYPSSDTNYHKDIKYSHDTTFPKDVKYSQDGANSKFQPSTSYHSENNSNKKEFVDKEPINVTDRLGRLEDMIKELVKHTTASITKPTAETNKVEKLPTTDVDDRGGFKLEPRRQSFTTSMWINKIQEVSVINNWSEKSTIQYMESQMSGIIKAWYNSLPNYDFSWPEWKLLITKTFPDNTDFITSLKRLVTRLKGADETMTNYYFSKMYLIEACKITGEDAVACLIDGLNNQEIQAAAKAQNFLTPETLFAQYLQNLPDYAVEYLPQGAVYNEQPETNHWYFDEPIELQGAEQQAESAHPPYPFNQEEVAQNYDQPIYEEPSADNDSSTKNAGNVHARLDKNFLHFKRHSTKRQPLALKICTFCHQRGHIAKQCRHLKRVQYTNKE